MSARKKKKLSLKKTTAPKPGGVKSADERGQNTILSMFKRQREKQIIDIESDADDSETKDQTEDDEKGADNIANVAKSCEGDGSEGDVVITKVESRTSDTFLKLSHETAKYGNEVEGRMKKKLSLKKTKKRKSSDLDDSDDFKPSKSKYYDKRKSKGSQSGGDSPARYNLRKSKTDPIVDESHSEGDMTIVRIDDKVTGAENESSQKENLRSTKDTDTASSKDEMKTNKTKCKLSLKKHKTESDVMTKTGAKVKIVVDLSEGSVSESDTKIDGTKKQHADAKCTKTNKSSDHVNNNQKGPKAVEDEQINVNQNTGKLTETTAHFTNTCKKTTADKGHRTTGDKNNDNASFQAKPSICEEIEEDTDSLKTPTDAEIKGRNTTERKIGKPDTDIKSKTVKEPVATFSIFKSQKLRKDNEDKKLVKTEETVSEVVADNDDSDDDSKADFLQNVEETTNDTEAEPLYKVPYYLENFVTILDTVLQDKENARLFDETDMTYMTKFHSLDGKFCPSQTESYIL